jgi:signal transduction histidine kinase
MSVLRVRRRWFAFVAGALMAVAGLAWVSRAVLTLEQEQVQARAEMAQAERVRLALWRLDSWMAPRLAAEAARPYFHYLALYPPRRAYDQFLSPIAAGEVLTPSPLLSLDDDVVRLHVQVDAAGRVTSPQVPDGAPWSAQVEPLLSPERRDEAALLLEQARLDLGGVPLVRHVEELIACQTMVMADDPQSEAPFVTDLLRKLSAHSESDLGPPAAHARRSPTTEDLVSPIPVTPTEGLAAAGPGLSSALVRKDEPDALARRSRMVAAAEPAAAERASREMSPARGIGEATRHGGKSAPEAGAPALGVASSVEAAGGVAGKAPAPAAGDRAAPSKERAGPSDSNHEPALADSARKAAPPAQRRGSSRPQSASRAGRVAEASGGEARLANQQSEQLAVQQVDNDYAKRLIQSNAAQWAAPVQTESGPDEPVVDVGPFVPLWVAHEDGEPGLYYFRRVAVGSVELAQGFLVDWPTLCALLREQVGDLLSEAWIEPVGLDAPALATEPTAEGLGESSNDTRLATIPARLLSGACEPPRNAAAVTPARATLGAAWLALLAAIIAAGFSLHATAADAARRARFAGAVTHELRTPLTTFQLYTEMLADGMVPPGKEGEYLATLRDESQRLGHLVENVLGYARIEQGRHRARREPITADALLAAVVQPLERRAAAAGVALRMESVLADPALGVMTDIESVERILFNLVDNAAKYALVEESGAPAAAWELILRAEEVGGHLHLLVVDHGPGISGAQRSKLFQPFERGSDDRTQQQRGIGLGLALSRELARALGGDLRHEDTPGGGATFRLLLE